MMKSPPFPRLSLALSIAALALAGAGLAQAQAPSGKQIKLKIGNGQTLDIPLDATAPAGVDGAGHIFASCALQNGQCPGLNAGAPAPGAPQITISSPAENALIAAADTAAQLRWSAPQAQACYGLAAAPQNSATTAWQRPWPASGSFVIGALPRHAQQETAYQFTLRCYAAGAAGAAAYSDISRSFRLAPAASAPPPPPPGGADACAEYMAAHNLAPGQNGFQPASLNPRIYNFDDGIFHTGGGQALNFSSMMNGMTGRAVLPSSKINKDSEYLSLRFDINQPLHNKGFYLTWIEQQDGGVTSRPSSLEITLSPCPGDFRKRPLDNTSPDLWNRSYCVKKIDGGGGPWHFLGGPNGQPHPQACFLPSPQPGQAPKTMYVNIAMHDMDRVRQNPNADPKNYSTCRDPQCGLRFDISRSQF